MKDNSRVYPVNKLIMHHAVSDLMVNWDDLAVQDWFSTIGKARGYNNGAIFPNHEHPSRPGQPTYAMAHWCLHPYTKDGNKYGWRLTELIKDSWNNVAWHAGNWPINQQSVGIEVAGNYVAEELDQKAFMLIADTFRGHDQHLGGALEIYGHKTFFATACPGLIFNKIDILIDMINNPKKWNDILWPPKPAPIIRKEQKTEFVAVPFATSTIDDPTSPNNYVRVAGKNGLRKIIYEYTFTDNVQTAKRVISDTTEPPVNEVRVRGTYIPPEVPAEPTKPVEPSSPSLPKTLTPWQQVLLAIFNFFKARQGRK